MQSYVSNRTCPCPRCKWNGLLGPAMLVTFGVLMLLDNLHWGQFHRTWPAILIVIGTVKLLQTVAPTAGHRSPDAAPALTAEPLAAPSAPEVTHE